MRRLPLAATVLLAFAVTALAATLAQVTADADALLVVYEDLEVRIAACPGGVCVGTEPQDILDDLADAEVDRAQLHSDLATLNPCSNCSSVDSTIVEIDDLAGELLDTTGNWDDEG